MSSQPKLGTYPLARSVIDSVRLNFAVPSGRSRFFGSFTLLYLSKGGLISALQIIWLLEAAEAYPNPEALEGLDITLHQAPPEHLRPENARFKELDLQAGSPPEFVGRYELVHARFLLGLVKNNDPLPISQNMLKLLKPNDYFQWSEVDWAADTYLGLTETNTMLKTSGLHKMRAAGKAFLREISRPQHMGEIVEGQGLQDVVVEKRTASDYPSMYTRLWTDRMVAAGIDMVSKLPERKMREKMARLADEAWEDARRGDG